MRIATRGVADEIRQSRIVFSRRMRRVCDFAETLSPGGPEVVAGSTAIAQVRGEGQLLGMTGPISRAMLLRIAAGMMKARLSTAAQPTAGSCGGGAGVPDRFDAGAGEVPPGGSLEDGRRPDMRGAPVRCRGGEAPAAWQGTPIAPRESLSSWTGNARGSVATLRRSQASRHFSHLPQQPARRRLLSLI